MTTKNEKIYAVYKHGVLMESKSWYPTNGWAIVHTNGNVYPLNTFKIEVKDVDHYIIDGAEYSKNDFKIVSHAEAAEIYKDRTLVKADENGKKGENANTNEVFKDIIATKVPNPDTGNWRPFTKAVINIIKRKGQIIPVPNKVNASRLTLLRDVRDKYYDGSADIPIDKAIFLLNTFNLQITDILREEYI